MFRRFSVFFCLKYKPGSKKSLREKNINLVFETNTPVQRERTVFLFCFFAVQGPKLPTDLLWVERTGLYHV